MQMLAHGAHRISKRHSNGVVLHLNSRRKYRSHNLNRQTKELFRRSHSHHKRSK